MRVWLCGRVPTCGVRPLLAGSVPRRSRPPSYSAHSWFPRPGLRGCVGTSDSSLTNPVFTCRPGVRPWGPLPGSSQRQRPCFTRFCTQPKNPERRLAHRGASFCWRVQKMKVTRDEEWFLTTLRSSRALGSGSASTELVSRLPTASVISQTSPRKAHFHIRF